jgi:DNA-binding protein Fis
MLKQMTVFLMAGLFLMSAPMAHAEYKKVQVIGKVETKRKNPKVDEQRMAIQDAKKKALDKYISGLDSQRVRILNNVLDEMRQNIDIYVPETVSLDDGNWNEGVWYIGVEAQVNEAQIEEIVNKYAQDAIKTQEETYLSFVFVAREADTVRKFDGKKTERAVESETINASESEDGYSGKSEKVAEKIIGGSVEKKSDRISYRSYIPEGIGSKVTEVFNKAEFDVVEPFDADINTDAFVNDFVENDEISNETKKSAVEAAKSAGLNYLAVATLDVGEQDVDQATGLQKVYVRVNGYVWDLSGKFTKKICSVGPVQYSGTGENAVVAKTNALINAASTAAKDLVDQMRFKQSK